MCSPLSPRPQVGESALLKAGRVAGVNKSGTASPATWQGPNQVPARSPKEPGSSAPRGGAGLLRRGGARLRRGGARLRRGGARLRRVEPGSAGRGGAGRLRRGGVRLLRGGAGLHPCGGAGLHPEEPRKPRREGWSPARPRGAGLLPERSGQNFCELRANRARLALPSESTDGRHARRGLSPRGPIHCVG